MRPAMSTYVRASLPQRRLVRSLGLSEQDVYDATSHVAGLHYCEAGAGGEAEAW